jgi:nitrogen fixation protein NifT
MKVMIRRNQAGVLSAYIAKKDLEEPIVEVEKAEIWGGLVKLANGWRLALPAMDSTTPILDQACLPWARLGSSCPVPTALW